MTYRIQNIRFEIMDREWSGIGAEPPDAGYKGRIFK